MKDNNPPEDMPRRPIMKFKIEIVPPNGKPTALRIGSERIMVATYVHGYVWWADGYPMAFLVDEERADPARKNHLEFAKYCPPDVAAEIGAYCWSRFPEVFPAKESTDREKLFLVVEDVARILMRIAQGK